MCTGGGGGDGGAARREAERQENIKAGYDQIRSIFDGYNKGINLVDTPVAGQSYYDASGQQVVYDPATGGQVYAGIESSPGFNDDFYNQRAEDYMSFANPQLEDQYKDAVKQLTIKLARAGILDSSTRARQFADLQKDYDLQKTQIAAKGQDYANTARSNVEGSRADLVAMNNSLANPTMIANEAQNRLASLRANPSFDNLAPLFTNVGEGIATQADLERRQSQRYNTGLFNSSYTGSGSSRSIS